MSTNTARIKLRAFKISNPNITEPNSGILPLLKQVLTDSSTAGQRKLKLNAEDVDVDLLAYFDWRSDYLFGMMLRIIPAEAGGVIDDDLFNQNKITIAEVSNGGADKSQYKDHYYFALNDNYVVTNLPGSFSIDRLQTYINFLLDDLRQTKLFEFAPVVKLPDDIALSEVEGIEFNGGGQSVATANITNSEHSASSLMQNLTSTVLDQILSDTTDLNSIQRGQIISAKLVLKVKSKPREMASEEYQRVMGAVVRQITNDSGISIRTKHGKYTGEAIKLVKDVVVDKTSTNRYVEEQLKQKMELFLNELNSNHNG